MIPIKIRLIELVRKGGVEVKNNDNRIPALLKMLEPESWPKSDSDAEGR